MFGTFYPISSETLQDPQLPLKVYYLDTTLTFSNTSTTQTILEPLNRCASNATLLVLFKIYLSDHVVDSLAKANVFVHACTVMCLFCQHRVIGVWSVPANTLVDI